MTAVPPALVAILPPMVQLPSEASDSGNRRPAASRRLLDPCQRDAGLDVHGQPVRVDGADAVEPPGRDDAARCPPRRGSGRRRGRCCRPAARSPCRSRRRAARIAATSAVAAGPQHQRRPATIFIAPLGQVGRLVGGIAQRVALADDGGEAIDEEGARRVGMSGGRGGREAELAHGLGRDRLGRRRDRDASPRLVRPGRSSVASWLSSSEGGM